MPHSPRLTPLRKATGNISIFIDNATRSNFYFFSQFAEQNHLQTDRLIELFFLYLNISSCNGIISKYKI